MNNEKILFRHEQPHGPGEVQIAWQTGGSGALLATAGADGTVAIYNRKGQLHERIILNGPCTGFGWDSDGDLLGMITLNSLQVTVWNVHTAKKQVLDLNLRDNPTCMVWAKREPILAVATLRGNLSLYNYATTKRVSVIGKHSKKVTSGCWSSEGLLALVAEERSLSVSTSDGDTLRVVSLRDTPYDVTFADMKTDERTQGENTISVILGRKTLFLYNLLDAENPIELGFQQKYGPLQIHKWFGDGYILLGFGAGHIVAISTHMQEVGQELFMVKSHKGLLDMSLAPLTNEVASCGDNCVKIHATSNLHETLSIISPSDESMVYHIAWNNEGSLLALTTARGALQVHVARLHPMGATCAPTIAILSSIAEITIYQHYGNKGMFEPFVIPLEIEPSFIGLSNRYLAAAMNNRIWLYQLPFKHDDNTILLGDRELMSNIKKMFLNNHYMAVVHGGKLSLQMLVAAAETNSEREGIIFPDNHIQDAEITCADLTQYFLIYGTDMGHVMLFSINDWTSVREYRHDMGIKSVHSDPTGTWIIVQDDRGDGYVYSPASEKIVAIPEFPTGCRGAIWDHAFATRHIFIIFTQTNIHLYVYISQAVNGTRVEKVYTVPRNHDELPLQLSDGEITFIASGGKITTLDIASAGIEKPNEQSQEINSSVKETTVKNQFCENTLERLIALRKLNEAWDVCEQLNEEEHWKKLGRAAIEHLNIEFAINVYRHLKDVAMVWSLEELIPIEEFQLLCGHCSVMLGLIEEACRYFLQSSQPQEALWLRRDMLQWQQALELARQIDITEFPFIAREYATELEMTGNYTQALQYFNEGLIDDKSDGDHIENNPHYNGFNTLEEHNILCMNGIARNSLRCGEIKKGLYIATRHENKQLAKECADILLENNHFNDAAEMYERAELWDQAAAIHIQLNSWNRVSTLVEKVVSPRIHVQYAEAKEKTANYEDAVIAYAAAKDYNSVIRIQLEHLNNPHAAVELLEQYPSTEGAKMVARFFQRINDHDAALKFLVLSGCSNEAYELARRHGLLQKLGQLLLTGSGTSADFRQLAEHFETQSSSLLAGKYYFYARDFSKALKHLLKASAVSSSENEALSLAVDTAASSNDEKLVAQLIEFLLGETDGIPKDPKYLFRLYMARKQFKESAKAAVIIANQDQINGNYKSAHDVLFSMYQELRHNDIPVPSDMRNSLNLLHSYILVRLHVKRGDHENAARLLLRVASNISKFPQHVVPILTSTVIECHRSGLKQSAFSYAATLMRAEYRSHVNERFVLHAMNRIKTVLFNLHLDINLIDPKYVKKIETIVRKTRGTKSIDTTRDEQESRSGCPYCGQQLPNMEINCSQCKMNIPFCIATGRHIIKDDLTACPECDFPAIKSEFIKILETESECPMCAETINPQRLVTINDASSYLNISG